MNITAYLNKLDSIMSAFLVFHKHKIGPTEDVNKKQKSVVAKIN